MHISLPGCCSPDLCGLLNGSPAAETTELFRKKTPLTYPISECKCQLLAYILVIIISRGNGLFKKKIQCLAPTLQGIAKQQCG